MNKEAAARIAAVVRGTGLPVLQAAVLVKAAADADLADRMMEKDAVFGKAWQVAKGVGQRFAPRMFGGAPRSAPTGALPPPMPKPPMPMPPPGTAPGGAGGASRYRLSPVRMGLTAGAGTVGYNHLSNSADNTVGRSANPLTWGSPRSEEDVFKHNQAGYDTARQGIQSEMDAALASGDMQKYTELNGRFQRGDFGGPQSPGLRMNNGQVEATGNWNPFKSRMFGLNPWAEETGAAHQGRMQSAQSSLQRQYGEQMGRAGAQPGDAAAMQALRERLQSPDLLPQQAQAMQRQLDALTARLARPAGQENDPARQIRERMEAAGMRFHGPRPAAPGPAPRPMGSGWNLGGVPRTPGYMSGAALMPGDFRPVPYPNPSDAVMGRNSPFQNG